MFKLTKLALVTILLLSARLSGAHSVQVAYCSSCAGDLRLFVEHWHATEDPNSTTMTIDVTINGNTTVQTGSPQASLQNVPLANLPGCTNPIQVLCLCPAYANTYNDWVIYDFTGLPCGVPLSFTIQSGNTAFTSDGCGMYPATISFTLGCGSGTLTDINVCEGQPTDSVPMSTTSTWTNNNPAIGLPASGTGTIPSFVPVGGPGTTATISYNSSCASGTFDINVLTPTAPSYIAANFCLNDLTQFTGADAGTLPVTNWEWDIGDDGTIESNSQNFSYTFPGGGTFPVSLTTTNADGCSIEYLANVVIDDPVANFTTNTVCAGGVTNFTDMSTITSGTISGWEWDFDGDGVIDDISQNPSYTYATAGTYNVTLTVTSSTGCASSVTLPVNVNPEPQANFSAPGVCVGSPSVFTDMSNISSGSVTGWQWDFGDGSGTSALQNPTYTYASSGTYNVSLTATSAAGCSNTVVLPVDVFDMPVANFSAVSGCNATATPFTDLSNPNGGTITSWDWDVESDGTVDYNTQNPSHTYPVPGNYNVQLTVTTAAGCSDVVTLPVTVYDSPVADFIAANVCLGTAVSFTDNSSVSAGGSITSYQWNFDNGNSSAVASPTELYLNEGVYNVVLSVTSSSGCVDSVVIPVTVYPIPVPQFAFVNACDGSPVTFNDQSSVSNVNSPNNIVSWSWNFGSSASAAQAPPAQMYPAPGTYPVTLTVTSNNGCTDSVTNNVTVYPNPVVDFSSPNPAGCTQWCVDFVNATTVTSGSIATYQWNLGAGFTSSQSDPTQCYINPTHSDVSYNVTLTATSNNGCVTSVTKPAFVTIYPEPVAQFDHTPFMATVYEPEISFQNTSILGNTYSWDFAGLGTSTAVNPSFVFPNTGGGTYDVCLTATSIHGCVNTYCEPVEVQGDWNVYAPNAFTPDGDGVNDLFQPSLFGISDEDYEFMVFDRWGELIFRTNSPDKKWDGTYKSVLCKPDVYVWKLKVKEVVTGQKMEFYGHFSLLK